MPGIYSTAQTNRPTCGGTKKAGLPPSVGSIVLNQFAPSMNRTVPTVPTGGKGCSGSFVKKYCCPGGVGMMFSYKQ